MGGMPKGAPHFFFAVVQHSICFELIPDSD
jgi:hypothetical protein